MNAILMHLTHSDLTILRDSVKGRVLRARRMEEKCRAEGRDALADFAFVEWGKAQILLNRIESNLERTSK